MSSLHRRELFGTTTTTMSGDNGSTEARESPRSPTPAAVYSAGIWKLRKAMLFWDLGHYGYELIYWCSTFAAFFLSALWDESFKLKEAAEESLSEATRRLMEVAAPTVQELVMRRLTGKSSETEYEYETTEGSGTEFEEEQTVGEGGEELAPGELNSYSAFIVGACCTLLIKYFVFPWIFMSLVPRLKALTADSFALGMFCTFKAFGKLVKIATDFALPIWLQKEGEELPDNLNKTDAVTSIGEYFGDFVFAPWLFVVYVMPVLKTILMTTQVKKDSEP